MIVNAHITGWRARSGSDKAGQATWATQTLARPLQCLRSGVSKAQAELLAVNELSADETVLYQADGAGAPDVAAGDRIQLDGAARWHEVVKVARVAKGAVSHRTLFLRELMR